MARKIAVVGNGQIEAGQAAFIDGCDLVVRFNQCTSYGQGGVRTDVVALCNTGRPAKAMLYSANWRSHAAVKSAGEIWSVRESGKFEAMKGDILARHPDLDDFFEDFTSEFADFARQQGKSHSVVARSVHEAVDEQLAELTSEPYVCPSSGLVTLRHVLDTVRKASDDVFIAGFGHQGWEGHPFSAEKQLIERWIAKGDLARL